MARTHSNLILNILLFWLSTFFAITVYAHESQSQYEVKKAYRDWCTSIGTAKGNSAAMVKFYAPDAILLATFSSTLLKNTHHGLDHYFKHLTRYKHIKCKTQKLITVVNDDMGVTTGFYTFSYLDSNGTKKVVPARFTFVYEKKHQQWLIINHHSSVVPK